MVRLSDIDLQSPSEMVRDIQMTPEPCFHDSTRIDGSLDDHCLKCGAEGHWHMGHRHDKKHPSDKKLFIVDCDDCTIRVYAG